MNRHPSLGQPAPKPLNGEAAAPRIPNVLVPMDVLQALVNYLKKRPYDEVAIALRMIAMRCKNEDGTPLEVTE